MPKSVKRARMASTGLCTTCTNEPSCTFPRKIGVPVMHCLEFDGETQAESPTARIVPLAPTPVADPPRREPGLCSWCENRPTCTFPRAAGGVWSCEEFL
jgi:hypothetical protein